MTLKANSTDVSQIYNNIASFFKISPRTIKNPKTITNLYLLVYQTMSEYLIKIKLIIYNMLISKRPKFLFDFNKFIYKDFTIIYSDQQHHSIQ